MSDKAENEEVSSSGEDTDDPLNTSKTPVSLAAAAATNRLPLPPVFATKSTVGPAEDVTAPLPQESVADRSEKMGKTGGKKGRKRTSNNGVGNGSDEKVPKTISTETQTSTVATVAASRPLSPTEIMLRNSRQAVLDIVGDPAKGIGGHGRYQTLFLSQTRSFDWPTALPVFRDLVGKLVEYDATILEGTDVTVQQRKSREQKYSDYAKILREQLDSMVPSFFANGTLWDKTRYADAYGIRKERYKASPERDPWRDQVWHCILSRISEERKNSKKAVLKQFKTPKPGTFTRAIRPPHSPASQASQLYGQNSLDAWGALCPSFREALPSELQAYSQVKRLLKGPKSDPQLIAKVMECALPTAQQISAAESVQGAINECRHLQHSRLYFAHCKRVFDYPCDTKEYLEKLQPSLTQALFEVCEQRGYTEADWKEYSSSETPFVLLAKLGSLLVKEDFQLIRTNVGAEELDIQEKGRQLASPASWFQLAPQSYAVWIEDKVFFMDSDMEAFYIYFSSFAVFRMEWNKRRSNGHDISEPVPDAKTIELFHHLIIAPKMKRWEAKPEAPKAVRDRLMDIRAEVVRQIPQAN